MQNRQHDLNADAGPTDPTDPIDSLVDEYMYNYNDFESHVIAVCITAENPAEGFKSTSGSKGAVIAHKIDEGWAVDDIIGEVHGIGVENLHGSGKIAGETSRAYDEIFTLSYVTGRSVGIGAYLNRLGQRVIQMKQGPMILTGYSALNKLLGRDVYNSQDQLGGPQIMFPNGVTHEVVDNDQEGVGSILKWLSFVPKTTSDPTAEQLVVSSSGGKTSIGGGSSRFGADPSSSSQKQNRLHHVDVKHYATSTLLAIGSTDATLMCVSGLLVIVAICVIAQYMGRVRVLNMTRRTKSSGCPIKVVWRPGKELQPIVLHRRRTSVRLFHKRALIAALSFFVTLFQPELVESSVSASADSVGGSTKTDGREAVGKGEGVFSALSGFMQRASHQLYGDTDDGRSSADPDGEHYQQSKAAAVAVDGDATGTTSVGSTSHATEVSEPEANR